MNLDRARILVLCALPLIAACATPIDESADTSDTSEAKMGVAAEAIAGGVDGVDALSGGNLSSLALKSDTTVWAWGDNSYGQLGDGTIIDAQAPVPVGGALNPLTGVTAVASGESNYSLALKSNGELWSWGSHLWGQLGGGPLVHIDQVAPIKVLIPVGLKVLAMAAATLHPLALTDDHTVWAWGFNGEGQLGNGSFGGNTTFPLRVKTRESGPLTDLSGITAIAGGAGHGLALRSDKTVWAWGNNDNGELGNGSLTGENAAIQVHGLDNIGYLTNVKAIAAGQHYSLALKEDGTVWAWGDNTRGQLGDASFTDRSTPVQVHGLTGITITALASAYESSFALTDTQTVMAWGYNSQRQLGDGRFGNQSTPAVVTGIGGTGVLSGITSLAAGAHHTLARKSDGTAYGWGANPSGQVGNATILDQTAPVLINMPCTGTGPAPTACQTASVCAATGFWTTPSKPDGTSCNDVNACTQTDTCQDGVCTGGNPVTCGTPDQCHAAGICDPSTGVCSNPTLTDGTHCDDSNACTQSDTCQAGTCTGASPVTCAAPGQCHDAGVCNPSTGVCSNPIKADGAGCSDSNACTQTDTCSSGVCIGANPVVCVAVDACHAAGICEPATGECNLLACF